MKRFLRAKFIAPIDQPVISDGVVVIEDGRIVAVGPSDRLSNQYPDTPIEHLHKQILLPGLVNAHTHLELTNIPRPEPCPPRFIDWLWSVISQTPSDPDELKRKVADAVEMGIRQSRSSGVTCIGDITRHAHLTRSLLRDSSLRIISFGEILAMAQRRQLLEDRLSSASDAICASPNLSIGLSPHAPYSVEPHGFCRCLAEALRSNLRITTHLAETPDETPFLASHTGPFRELWTRLNAWDDNVPIFEGGPIRLAQSLGLLDHATLLAHVNYCDDEELQLLSGGRASVIFCPRTHAYFNHPAHRWPDMLSVGINVALGTDSAASSGNLNLLEDLRLLHQTNPAAPPELLWKMATLNGAKALLLDHELGSLTPGKRADIIAFPIRSEDPLREILTNPTSPQIL